MALEVGVEQQQQEPVQRWLRRVDDDSVFAYARGHILIRFSDHTPWAHLDNDQLRSARSGNRLAYRVGNIYYDATTNQPSYYELSDAHSDAIGSRSRSYRSTRPIGSPARVDPR